MPLNYDDLSARLTQVLGYLAGATSIDDLAGGLFDAVMDIVSPSHAGFFFFEPATGQLRVVRARGFSPEELKEAERTAIDRHPMRVIRSGKILHVPDTFDDPLNQTQSASNAWVIRSRLYLPVWSGDKVVGTLGLADTSPHAFSEMAIQVLHVAASLAGVIYGRLEAEEAARRKAQELHMVIDGAQIGTWEWEIDTGKVAFNARWIDMLGYDRADIEPHVSVWERLLHPDDAPEVMRVLQAHLDGLTAVYCTEHRLKTKTGAWKWVLDIGQVLQRDSSGRATRAAGIHQDIDVRKQAEQTLHEGRQLLERLVGERTASLAHTIELLQAEVEQRKRTETYLVEYQDRLTRATESLVVAEEVERRRIALQVHDGIGQELTLLRLHLRNVLRNPVAGPGFQARLGQLDESLVGIMKAARGLTMDLSPAVLYEFGLREAIDGLLERVQHQHALAVSLHWRTLVQLSEIRATVVYGTVRELIHNVIKHANARSLAVTCWRRKGAVWLRVADDGVGFTKGFSVDTPTADGRGYGLFAWRERLVGVGGLLHVRRRLRRGAVIDIELPDGAADRRVTRKDR